MRAIRIFPRMTGNITNINILKPFIHRYFPRFLQYAYRGWRNPCHFIHGIETGKVDRHVGSNAGLYPRAHSADHLRVVIVTWNNKVGDFNPNT